MMTRLVPTLSALALALAACTPEIAPSASGVALPASWMRLGSADDSTGTGAKTADRPLASNDAATIEQAWWRSFGDPILDQLIAEGLANNKTLQIAQARVAEARANRSGADAALLPEISGTGAANRGNQGYATNNKAVSITELDLQASWEIDLFGKNQAHANEAAAILQSTDAGRQATLVTLLADIARNYFELRNDEEQIRITQANLATQRKTLELIKAQQAGALSSGLDVERAAAQVSTTSAQLPALQAAYEVTLDHLNVLLGQPPGARDKMVKPAQPLRPLDPHILVAAPARVLANRPDVRAAERSFAASVAAADAAAKEIYPTISLTALFGVQQSTPFSMTPWGVGASLAQPILNFGRIQAKIDAADARQQQALLQYQQTVLEALEDMENALSRYLHETARQHDLEQAAEQNQRSVVLATEQYTSGYSGLLDLLVAEHNELDAESSLAVSNAQLRENLVTIYAAAGGG
ncbi:MAG: efflux transporter outer membrane subunit [Azospirillaceae bacterium]|nr:efflux transporter outer membrane subunit [Azospirillaceae bacterium]